jgi:anti-sigma factor RsiW
VSEQALTCRDVVAILTDYLEGALSVEDRRRVEDHLAICDGCTSYLRQLRKTIRLTGMIDEEQIPEEQKRRLLDAFRDWTR